MLVGIGLPIVALLGAGMVMARLVVGAAMSAITVTGFVLVHEFNFVDLIATVLLGLGAVLGFLGWRLGATKSSQSTWQTRQRQAPDWRLRRSRVMPSVRRTPVSPPGGACANFSQSTRTPNPR